MKPIYFAGAAMIAVAIYFLANIAGDTSTYATFSDASESGGKVKIAGSLSKDKAMVYNPEQDPNHFSFFITDSKGEERQVVLLGAKPQDFELSEQIVVTGKMKGETFVATEMLMKCPSKYKDEEIKIKSEQI
jgi:cytochrome c-type biogenesis protein CcmE